ncbi:MAG TPA: hypothetical protein VKA04_12675 [Pseudodesulfovibrio sp.]|nr:hypothetical protein [Pseudodesulfovibrio sp.]
MSDGWIRLVTMTCFTPLAVVVLWKALTEHRAFCQRPRFQDQVRLFFRQKPWVD